MRRHLVFVLLVASFGLFPVAAPIVASAGEAATVEALASQPPKDLDVDINVNRGGDAWYANPVWLAIGAIALVVVVLLIALAVRGGGTTVVRE